MTLVIHVVDKENHYPSGTSGPLTSKDVPQHLTAWLLPPTLTQYSDKIKIVKMYVL